MPLSRWTRALQITLLVASVLLLTFWALPSRPRTFPDVRQLSEFVHRNTPPQFSFTSRPALIESPLLTPSEIAQELEAGNVTTAPQHLNKGNPSFHLIISGAKRSAKLCRSLLSAAVLDHPPPTLINYDDGSGNYSSAHQNDVEAVNNFLHDDASAFREDDVVLVVDGESTLFQLPASVLLHRLQTFKDQQSRVSSGNIPSYNHSAHKSIYFPASDQCALSPKHDSCSGLPQPKADALPSQPASNRKHIDGNAALGSISEMRKLFRIASSSASRSNVEDLRAIVTNMYAQQELSGASDRTAGSRLKTRWRTLTAYREWASRWTATFVPQPERDLSLTLDYHAKLFLSASQSQRWSFTHDANRMPYNNESALPADIATAPPPIRVVPTTYVDDVHNSSTLPLNETVDRLDGRLQWQNMSLTADQDTETIPALIQYQESNADGRGSWALWHNMWYFPFARALMRNHLRSAEGPAAIQAAITGGDRELDVRGGKGGFWTDTGTWLEFGEVCRGFEDQLFADGFGEWGHEGGGHPRCDINWKLYSGEGDCDKLREEAEAEEKVKELHEMEAETTGRDGGGEEEMR